MSATIKKATNAAYDLLDKVPQDMRPSGTIVGQKVCQNWDEALKDVKSGLKLGFGGFGLSGIPIDAIHALRKRSDIRDIIAISTESGVSDWGLGLLMGDRQIKRQICSFIGRCKIMEKQYLAGDLELEWRPQGSLAEAIRCGAAGIPGFYTKTGANTWIEEGKVPLKYNKDKTVAEYCPKRESKIFDGKKYLWETAIIPDFAFVKAKVADTSGNCRFHVTAQNFNKVLGQSAKVTIVEAEEIVEVGQLHPDDVHLPALFVNRVILAEQRKPVYEHLVYACSEVDEKEAKVDHARERILKRAAMEFKDGQYVNLGVGMPSDSAKYAKGVDVHIQTENGLIGVGGLPKKGQENVDLIDAGKTNIVYRPGAASFDSAESFLQIRGGHLAMSMLGAYEVSQYGDLANWMIPNVRVSGMGGAMDLVAPNESTKIVILTKHNSKDGSSKIVKECSLPLTGARCVSRIITEKAVFDVDSKHGLTLIEKDVSISIDELKKDTGAPFKVAERVEPMLSQTGKSKL
jgi:3-oxoacid CoA-transferase